MTSIIRPVTEVVGTDGLARTVVGCSRLGVARTLIGAYIAGLVTGERALLNAFTHWWTVPRAVEVAGITYVAAVADDGVISVVTYDGAGYARYKVGTTVDGDDHHVPALVIDPARAPIVVWSEHNANALIQYRIGSGPGVLPTAGTPLRTISFAGAISYQEVFASSAGDLTVLCRRASRYWMATQSDDWAESWGTPATILDFGVGDQGYIIASQAGDSIVCGTFGNPINSDQHDIGYMVINLATGAITDVEGTVLGNLSGTNLPLIPATFEHAYTAPTDGNTRLMAVAPEAVAYVSWDDTDQDATAMCCISEWSGSAWVETQLVTPGEALDPGEGNTQYGGMAFGADGALFISREDAGTWTIEKWTADGGWSLDEVIASSFDPIVRPTCPVGASVGPEVVWHEVLSYTNFAAWSANLAPMV